METFKSKTRFTVIALLFVSTIAIFSSCTNNNDTDSVPPAHVMIVNTVAGSAGQDFYLNNVKINSPAVAYGQSTAYITTQAGTDNAQFFNSGTKTVNNSFSLTLEPGNYYTVYYTGKNTTSANYTTLDNVSTPPAGSASIQFINFNADVSSGLDFGVVGASKIASNVLSGSASAYYSVAANSSLAVYLAGSSNIKLPSRLRCKVG